MIGIAASHHVHVERRRVVPQWIDEPTDGCDIRWLDAASASLEWKRAIPAFSPTEGRLARPESTCPDRNARLLQAGWLESAALNLVVFALI